MSKIATGIAKKIGQPDIIEKITQQLSLSELNSFLLEVSRKASQQITPAELQKNYENNRFVSPSLIDPIAFMEFEMVLQKLAKQHGFIPMELSPVSPLGSCSAIATVDQNKIISAGRGTEVTADATNLLALECSRIRKQKKFDRTDLKFCSIHRHIRAQQIGNVKGHSPHFKIFCAVTAGKDRGSFEFEKESLLNHLDFYKEYLKEKLGLDTLIVRFKALNDEDDNRLFMTASEHIKSTIKEFEYQELEADQSAQQYYKRLQFKIYLMFNNREFEIGDGGYVDWTQKLTGNKKERLLISAIGIEFLFKILNGMI